MGLTLAQIKNLFGQLRSRSYFVRCNRLSEKHTFRVGQNQKSERIEREKGSQDDVESIAESEDHWGR